MSSTTPIVYLSRLEDVKALAQPRAALFLSASVPYLLDESKIDLEPDDSLDDLNARYWATRQPARIRAAVSALTRVTLGHDIRLVFGAHPSISPMVLQAASDMHAPPGSVVVFQSDVFATQIPAPTLQLANWKSGQLVMTARQAEPAQKKRFPNSLAFMRAAMTEMAGLQGAVFIGGLRGVELEANLFQARHPGLRRYAIASTGSAAAELAARPHGQFAGTLSSPDAQLLRSSRSYSLVAHKIVSDLLRGGHP